MGTNGEGDSLARPRRSRGEAASAIRRKPAATTPTARPSFGAGVARACACVCMCACIAYVCALCTCRSRRRKTSRGAAGSLHLSPLIPSSLHPSPLTHHPSPPHPLTSYLSPLSHLLTSHPSPPHHPYRITRLSHPPIAAHVYLTLPIAVRLYPRGDG